MSLIVCVLAVAFVASGLTAAVGFHFWWIRRKQLSQKSRGFPVVDQPRRP